MARTPSRKRRPAGARPAGQAGDVKRPSQPAGRQAGDGKRAPRAARAEAKTRGHRSQAGRRTSPAAPTYGERPPAPWHPLPISELLILVGAIGTAIGFARAARHGVSSGGATLLAGIAAVAIGTFEVTLREHRSGYRSHTIMLALLPVLVFHSLVLFVVSELTTAPRLLNVGLFAVDIALFALLFRMLRAGFLDARHARVLREG
jgi:hypothetical protein